MFLFLGRIVKCQVGCIGTSRKMFTFFCNYVLEVDFTCSKLMRQDAASWIFVFVGAFGWMCSDRTGFIECTFFPYSTNVSKFNR